MTSNTSPNLLWKHRRISEQICCPTCKSGIEFDASVWFHDIPFVGNVSCKRCGVVGTTVAGRTIFGSPSPVTLGGGGTQIRGALSQIPEKLTANCFSPAAAWHSSEAGYWSNEPLARFSFVTDALSVGITLLKHPWSGIAEVWRDQERVEVVDLYEEAGSMRHWVAVHLGEGSHTVDIVVRPDRNPKSNDCQVHVLEIECIRHTAESDPKFTYSSRNRGNPYPAKFAELIDATGETELILDCGSGDRNYDDPRVVSFEYCRFEGPDVFGDGHCLPFKDNSFDLVLSQAVIEHLYDPALAAREIFRVLKPGGRLYVESAFMQPLHAVPYHFFNTTGWGLAHLFRDFTIQAITHEGQLADTLRWIYGLTALESKGFGPKVAQLLELAKELDQHISSAELKNFSSFVTLLAIKPPESI